MSETCTHLDRIDPEIQADSEVGCGDCLAIGGGWVHLRECMSCGHVACCDESPNQHATKHFHASGHPIIRSIEPGESWWWCYVDELAFTVDSP